MSTEVRKNTAGRFAHIDAMRAFAVLLVVVAHAGAGLIVPGGSGVTIFFAISGLIITLLVLREQDKTGGFAIGGFFFRRAAKILPPLIVVVLVPSLVWACFGPLDWGALAAQIFFVFNWVKASGDLFHVLPGSVSCGASASRSSSTSSSRRCGWRSSGGGTAGCFWGPSPVRRSPCRS